MPIHDWTRVRANRFHDFRLDWIIEVRRTLNEGILPPGYFALAEQVTGGSEPDVIALESLDRPDFLDSGGISVATAPPKIPVVARSDASSYARKAKRVAIRHRDGELIAVIEIVSPGNKDSRNALRALTRKAVRFLNTGVHLLIIDLFPPTPRDPQGIHKAIWDQVHEEPYVRPENKPLTVAAYLAGVEKVAYVQCLSVGDPLPDSPIFLTPDRYVNCPLETTYRTSWGKFPKELKGPLESH